MSIKFLNQKPGGKEEEAIKSFSASISISPSPEVLSERAALYTKLKQYDKALADLNVCLAKDPNNEKQLLSRARIYKSKEMYAESLKDFESYLKLHPDADVIFEERGDILMQTGQYENAAKDFVKAALTFKNQ